MSETMQNLQRIREEETFYHNDLYKNFEKTPKSWLDFPVKELVDLGLELGQKKSVNTFLDLGAGIGRNSFPMLTEQTSSGLTIELVDILPSGIETAMKLARKENVAQNIKGYVSDIATFPIKPDYYDFIYAVSSLEHLASQSQLLQVLDRIKAGIKRQGYFYLIINSEVKETVTATQQEIEPYFELNLSTEKIITLLNSVFIDWQQIDLRSKKITYPITRSFGDVQLSTRAVTVVFQKI